MERRGLKPKNHAKDNIVALREKQRENREKQYERENPKAAQEWKLQQFKGVKSKIASEGLNRFMAGGERPEAADGRPAAERHFLKRGSLEARMERAKEANESPRRAVAPPRLPLKKMPVPRLSEAPVRLSPRIDRDFVRANRSEAITKKSPRKPERVDPGKRHADFGSVPGYILEQKERKAQEEARRRAAAPDPNCPPGMQLMPEHERLETLKLLEASEKETQALLFKIPLTSTVQSVVKRKNALEEKLKEIESAKKIFSKKQVYVAS